MTRSRRIVLFVVNLFLLSVIFFVTTDRLVLTSEASAVVFSALLMLSFVTLFLEHFFTAPTDVLASTIAILLLLAPLHSQLSKFGRWYWIFFAYNLLLLGISLLALLLLDDNKSSTTRQNRLSSVLKKIAVYFGNGRFLFFALFFLTLVFYSDNQSHYFLLIAGYASVILLVDPKKFVLSSWRSRRKTGVDIGEIIGSNHETRSWRSSTRNAFQFDDST